MPVAGLHTPAAPAVHYREQGGVPDADLQSLMHLLASSYAGEFRVELGAVLHALSAAATSPYVKHQMIECGIQCCGILPTCAHNGS
jgi:hypothetical protein